MKFETAVKKLVAHPYVKGIVEEIGGDFSWTHGGCFAFAEALVAAIPQAELWAVGQEDVQADCADFAAQHAFVCHNGKFYDSDGLRTEAQLIRKYGWKTSEVRIGKVADWVKLPEPDTLWYPVQEFVDIEQIKQMAKIFRGLVANGKGTHENH